MLRALQCTRQQTIHNPKDAFCFGFVVSADAPYGDNQAHPGEGLDQSLGPALTLKRDHDVVKHLELVVRQPAHRHAAVRHVVDWSVGLLAHACDVGHAIELARLVVNALVVLDHEMDAVATLAECNESQFTSEVALLAQVEHELH